LSALLSCSGVTRELCDPEPFTLVDDVSFEISAGEMVAILGPSGCGKSSLLYLIGLLDRPTRGYLQMMGKPTERMSDAERTRLRLEQIGFVFQFHFLLPELTALANVTLPMRRLGLRRPQEIDAHARQLLEKLGVGDVADRRPDRLSGGQRQRVAIARALANDPAIVLGDEPTGNLDSGNTQRVIDEFRRLAHEEGRAVICVTHDASVAAAADRRVQMLDGRIVP